MPNRLFISNFKKNGLSKLVHMRFCVCVVLVLISYPLLRSYLLQYHRNNGYGISEDLAIFLRDSEQPEVIIAGTSRNGLAIHEPTVESILSAACVKIPIMASSPWEVLQVLKRNPDKLVHTKLVIMDLQPCQFNENYSNLFQAGNTKTALETPFPRICITSAIKEALQKQDYSRMDDRWKVFEKNPHENSQENMSSLVAADRFMNDYDFSEYMDQTLRELIHFCQTRNIYLVLNIPPARYEHVVYINSKYPEGYEQFNDYIQRVSREMNCCLIMMETFPIEYGNDTDLFMDYGHMREKAAIIYSKWLAEKILFYEQKQVSLSGK